MSCDKFHADIAAFLDGELDERASDELRRHAEECSICTADIRANAALVNTLKSHPGRNVPESVEARVLKGLEPLRNRRRQIAWLQLLRSHVQGVFSMKRKLIAVGLAAIIALIIGVLSPKADPALAAVAQAMSSIRNVHITGWITQDGKRCRFEGWIEGSSRMRSDVEGAPIQIVDGKRLIEISKDSVIIKSSRNMLGPEGTNPMQGFSGDFWQEIARRSKNSGSVKKSDGVLPDGRASLVLRLESGGDRTVIAIAKDTDLVARIQNYDSKNELTLDVQHVEYNLDIPAEVFNPEYPASAQVIDTMNRKIGDRCTVGQSCSLASELQRMAETDPVALSKLASNCDEVAELIVKGVQTMDVEERKRRNPGSLNSWHLARPIALRVSKTHTLPPGSELRIMNLLDPSGGAPTARLDLYISLIDQGELGYEIPLTDTVAR
ncbi:MAG: zf-HC2 domain-containing protein [Armatimonadota bacterium]|nr:zf-HC2 domain-containing protein [Armatimonadota bacterium]